MYDPDIWTVAYALVYIESPEEKSVQLRFGSDDGSKVWLNNKEIWALNLDGPGVFDHYKIDATLKPGLNKVLVKVCNTVGDWGFFLRVADEDGRGAEGITFVSASSID